MCLTFLNKEVNTVMAMTMVNMVMVMWRIKRFLNGEKFSDEALNNVEL